MISTLLLKREVRPCGVWHSAARLPFVQIGVALDGSSFKELCPSRCLVGLPVAAWSSAVLFALGPGGCTNIRASPTLPGKLWSSPFLKSGCALSLFTCSWTFKDKLTLNFHALRVISPSALITKLSFVLFGYSKHEQDGVCCTPACQQIRGVHFSPCLAALLAESKADSSRACCLCPLPRSCIDLSPISFLHCWVLALAGACKLGSVVGNESSGPTKGTFSWVGAGEQHSSRCLFLPCMGIQVSSNITISSVIAHASFCLEKHIAQSEIFQAYPLAWLLALGNLSKIK